VRNYALLAVSPGEQSNAQTSTNDLEESPVASGVGFLDSGVLKLFEPDHRQIATSDCERSTNMKLLAPITSDMPPIELQQGFVETFFEYCWPWCPVLDKSTLWEYLDTTPSPLLVNSLALLGSRVRPPILQHASASDYYDRAKLLFYTDQESNPLVNLRKLFPSLQAEHRRLSAADRPAMFRLWLALHRS
jgi:hypothetical protein